MRMKDADSAVAQLSRKQHGAWSRRQALAAGMTAKGILVRRRAGMWLSLDNAVFGHAAAAPTWHRSVMAAVLAEPWAAASHRSAAVLHQLEGFRPGRPEVTIKPGANARGRLATAHRGVDVRTTIVDGIPTVTLDQVFIDLAPSVSEARLQRALSMKAHESGTLLEAVRDRYCALAPRGGRDLRRLRAVLDRFGAGDLPRRSELESVMAHVLDLPQIPSIVWEAPFPGRSPGKQRVDGLISDWSLIIEGDGRAWHTRIEDFERDRRRDAEAAAAGLLTLRFTWHQLVHESSWVQDIVLQAGMRRAA
jgi:hypothetical protein